MGKDHGRRVVGGAGLPTGFATLIVRYPEDELTEIVLIGRRDIGIWSVWAAISNGVFGEQ